jgi:archaellum biogenesis ATPase FlaH
MFRSNNRNGITNLETNAEIQKEAMSVQNNRNLMDQKIEKWKNKLLDISKRNRLLNYRETKRSSLSISSTPEDTLSLWDTFVKNEQPLKFPHYDKDVTERESNAVQTEEVPMFLASNPKPRHKSNTMQTNQSIKLSDIQKMLERQKTLRNLRDKARLANAEQGVNVLYLSFGFLKWAESATSEDFFNAPVILVPATLTVKSITSPYTLSRHEDEIVVNPTLRHKLENDFGITLPVFKEEDGIKLYLEEIRELIANSKWEVNFDVSLSLLSFLKINMYNDLIHHLETIKQHDVIRTISGDPSAHIKISEDLINFDFDKNWKPNEIFQVVDADSSQQEAILWAKRSVSFVLQGPPGTGKSQTITNIISECLAEGKKVLFVSEKMAALEVVHKKLTDAELNDFCLSLHSHKASKKAVLEQLGKVLEMADRKVALIDGAHQKLDALQEYKEQLNNYAHQLPVKISPLNKSIYEANSILSHLTSYGDVIFSIKNPADTTEKQYNRQIYLLTQLSNATGNMSEEYSHNPWNGTQVTAITFELRTDIGIKLPALISKNS